jgi:hypothetical protein
MTNSPQDHKQADSDRLARFQREAQREAIIKAKGHGKPAERMGAWRTDYLEVNGVRVRLVVQMDKNGVEYVVLDADGNLEGLAPGAYYPTPLAPNECPACGAMDCTPATCPP